MGLPGVGGRRSTQSGDEAANGGGGLRVYGEMDKISDTEMTFPCGQRHDELMRLLMPYSRNISSVEGMMAAEALCGQMTTGTLGFSQT